MSNVLKALKKSEQGYNATQRKQTIYNIQHDDDEQKNGERKKAWLIFVLFILPILISFVALFALQQKQIKNQTVTSAVVMDSEVLPYPDFSSLENLPEPLPREVVVVSATNSEKEEQFNEYASAISSTQAVPKTQEINPSSSTATETISSRNSQLDNGGVENIDLSEVTPELAQLFQEAVKSTDRIQSNPKASDFGLPVINLVGNEQQFRQKLPPLNLETHIYSTIQPSWVKINGIDLREGERLADSNLKIDKILPGSLIVLFEGQYIQIPALYEWKG